MILFISLVYCTKKEQTFYDDGILKSTVYLNANGEKEGEERIFYPSGNLKAISYYEKGVLKDSTIKFDEDGRILSVLKQNGDSIFLRNYRGTRVFSEGRVDERLNPIGWWWYYNHQENDYQVEYAFVHNKHVINQNKFYKDNSIDSLRSNYYDFIKPEKIKAQTPYNFEIQFNFEKDTMENLLGKDYYYLLVSPKINADFSNIQEIALDTLVPIQTKTFVYHLGFKSPGIKNFRAIIEKHILVKENDRLFIDKAQIFIDEVFNVE